MLIRFGLQKRSKIAPQNDPNTNKTFSNYDILNSQAHRLDYILYNSDGSINFGEIKPEFIKGDNML